MKGMSDYAENTGKGVETKDTAHACAANGDGGVGTSKRPETRNGDLWEEVAKRESRRSGPGGGRWVGRCCLLVEHFEHLWHESGI